MKVIQIKTILLLTLCLTTSKVVLAEQTEEVEVERIPVQVRVVSAITQTGWDRSTSAFLSVADEFYQFSQAFEKGMGEWNEHFAFELRRFPARIDESKAAITIYLHEWRPTSDGLINARFAARSEWNGKKENLGHFRGTRPRSASMIRLLDERSYQEAMASAVKRFAEKASSFLEGLLEEEGS